MAAYADTGRDRRPAPAFAAIDLGTNNCRLLIARPVDNGFTVVDAFSRIVRLGEGMTQSGRLSDVAASPLDPGDEGDDLWNLALEAARLDEVVDQAVRTLEPAVVAKYAFSLAQAFNGMYHKYPILAEERPEHRAAALL